MAGKGLNLFSRIHSSNGSFISEITFETSIFSSKEILPCFTRSITSSSKRKHFSIDGLPNGDTCNNLGPHYGLSPVTFDIPIIQLDLPPISV